MLIEDVDEWIRRTIFIELNSLHIEITIVYISSFSNLSIKEGASHGQLILQRQVLFLIRIMYFTDVLELVEIRSQVRAEDEEVLYIDLSVELKLMIRAGELLERRVVIFGHCWGAVPHVGRHHLIGEIKVGVEGTEVQDQFEYRLPVFGIELF